MALNSLFCADVPLRNYTLTHSLTYPPTGSTAYEREMSTPPTFLRSIMPSFTFTFTWS